MDKNFEPNLIWWDGCRCVDSASVNQFEDNVHGLSGDDWPQIRTCSKNISLGNFFSKSGENI